MRQNCSDYDNIILDLPSGAEEGVRELFLQVDEETIVTTGEANRLTDAYALIKATRRKRGESSLKIIVNFAENVDSGRQTQEGLACVCRRFLIVKPSSLGIIMRDTHVSEVASRQMPLLQCYPGCNAAQDIIIAAKTSIESRKPE